LEGNNGAQRVAHLLFQRIERGPEKALKGVSRVVHSRLLEIPLGFNIGVVDQRTRRIGGFRGWSTVPSFYTLYLLEGEELTALSSFPVPGFREWRPLEIEEIIGL